MTSSFDRSYANHLTDISSKWQLIQSSLIFKTMCLGKNSNKCQFMKKHIGSTTKAAY